MTLGASSLIPEFAGLYVGVLIERQLLDQFLDESADVTGVDAAQSSVHPQRLTDRHQIKECVELRTEADQTSTSISQAALHADADQERVARRDADVTGQHAERCRLPGAVDSQQTETLTAWYAD